DVGEEPPMGIPYATSIYGGQRRRRMSLLQTLRQQNRQLNDSGLEIHRPRTDSESTNRGEPKYADLKSKTKSCDPLE
ncbi:hypothetical protein TELCIR_22091, partial [Teladorsagia circumcincta]